MYAVFAAGGKQHRVEVGSLIDVEKIEAPVGEEITFPEVLAIGGDDGEFLVGQPHVPNGAVVGEIVEQGKEKKIIVFKSKRRKGYKRKLGHRQRFTRLKITDIQGAGSLSETEEEDGS